MSPVSGSLFSLVMNTYFFTFCSSQYKDGGLQGQRTQSERLKSSCQHITCIYADIWKGHYSVKQNICESQRVQENRINKVYSIIQINVTKLIKVCYIWKVHITMKQLGGEWSDSWRQEIKCRWGITIIIRFKESDRPLCYS